MDRVIAPAKLGWKFAGSKDSSADPGSGKFYYHPGGGGGIIGYLRFSFITNNGCDLSDGKFNDSNVNDNGPSERFGSGDPIAGGPLEVDHAVPDQNLALELQQPLEFGLTSNTGRAFSEMGDTEYCVTVGGFF